MTLTVKICRRPRRGGRPVGVRWTHGCGIMTDQSLHCWGCGGGPEANLGQCNYIDGTYTSIGSGTGHSCGLNSDNEIICWGCGDGTWNFDKGQCASPILSE